MNYSKVNNLVGWITGIIATTVYLVTMEPTVSFWDCGEFISCAHKIEVGHSPGAPLFMMIQRLFGLFAFGDVHKVAMMMNAWSATASGLTILFLFWTITHFARRLMIGREGEPAGNQLILIMGAGLVGALAYTFSDTFWFSAVEAEVYATSSFFTALVFWAILKWEHVADKPGADKWLVFIAYMMGLSVGIHLLNLLAIPAIAMVYYFRKYDVTPFGTFIAFLVGCALLGLVQFGVLQGLPIIASKLDLFFVNNMGMPFDTGAFVFIALLIAALAWGVMYVKRKGLYLAHTGMLCLIFIIIGFTSYLAPLIRSRADVPIDMTNPDNAISLVSYIQREQFGSQPLLFGPDFDKRPVDYKNTGKRYVRSSKDGKDHYEEVGNKLEPVFDGADKRFFPRIWDYNDPGHIRFYRQYLGLAENEAPSSSDNFRYFFDYQINWMWWRYFMWNYAGRQNDIEGQGDPKNGNWISGITPIDKFFGKGDINARNAEGFNDGYKNTPSRNQLYMLPFALGIIGLLFQFNKNKRDGFVVLVLFFFTGIATAIYLNMTPLQPRERDYAFAGSTYAFAVWIGLGVLMVNEWFQKFLKGNTGGVLAIVLCLAAVPVLMAAEEWDDHDRSKKKLAHATATNVLNACEPNAILFTFGDNDTYPLWYLQEVEGYRTDVRIINMSLLGIDWYIDQLNHRINEGMPVPMIWKPEHYLGDKRNYMRYVKSPQIPSDRYFNLGEICNFIISDNPDAKVQMSDGSRENFLPTKNFFIPSLTKEELVAKKLVAAEDTARINTEVKFTFPKDIAYKDDLATLNLVAAIAQQGWERPIYFSGGLPGDNYIGMDDYMRLEGVVYRLLPYKMQSLTPGSMMGEIGSINVEKSLDLFLNKFSWGNAHRNDVYFDEKNRLMFMAYKMQGSRLAIELSAMGRNEDAKKVLDKLKKGISEYAYPYDVMAYTMAMAYYTIGDKAGGREIAMKLSKIATDEMNYYQTLKDDGKASLGGEISRSVQIIGSLSMTARQNGDEETAKQLEAQAQMMQGRIGR